MISTNSWSLSSIRNSSSDNQPSCGGNGGRRISVARCPIGFLRPVGRRIAPADSHRCFYLHQTDPPAPSSDLPSAPKRNPGARRSTVSLMDQYLMTSQHKSKVTLNTLACVSYLVLNSPAALFCWVLMDRRSWGGGSWCVPSADQVWVFHLCWLEVFGPGTRTLCQQLPLSSACHQRCRWESGGQQSQDRANEVTT